MAALLAGMSTVTLADDKEEKGPENPLKKLVRDEFQIPQMIAEREAQKQKEYAERADIEVKELGMR